MRKGLAGNSLSQLEGRWRGRGRSVYKAGCEGIIIQTPGNYPEENIQHTEHGESLKSRKLNSVWGERSYTVCCSRKERSGTVKLLEGLW
jgi:hypothetical protein